MANRYAALMAYEEPEKKEPEKQGKYSALMEYEEPDQPDVSRETTGQEAEKRSPQFISVDLEPVKRIAETGKDFSTGLLKGAGTAVDRVGKALGALTYSAQSALPGGDKPTSPLDAFKKAGETEYGQNVRGTLEPKNKAEAGGKFTGDMAVNTAIGGGMASAVMKGATGLVPTLARGAVQNIPMIPKSFEEGGEKGATIDIIANTALDALLFGGGKLIGGALKKGGKEVLLGEMKIEKPLAKKVSKSFDEAKTKIAGTIDKYKLNKVFSNFDGMAKKADDLAGQKYKEADRLVDEFVKTNPNKKIDILDVYNDLEQKLIGKDSPLASDEIQAAKKMISNIIDGQIERGLIPTDGMVNLNQLVEIKRDIKKGKDLFKRGAGAIATDPTKVDVYKQAFHNVVDKISESVPESRVLNTEAKDLFFVSEAADAAASRIRNHNKVFGLSEIVIGGGGGIAAASNPGKAVEILTISALTLGGKRALSQGRGAALMKESGEQFGKLGGKKTIATANILSNIASPKNDEEAERRRRLGTLTGRRAYE